jgi:hypothetical protein
VDSLNVKSLIFLYLFLSTNVIGSISDFIYPKSSAPSFSNYGTVGLIQMPSARFHPEGSLAFSWTDMDPYLRGSIVAYPFEWFEASYQYIDINNALYSDIADFSGRQTYKDKSFSAKFRLLKERDFRPQLAIGFRDLAGTGVFTSEYLVASKKISNVDLSLGIGWGMMSENTIRNPFMNISDRFKSREINSQKGAGGEINFDSFFGGPAGLFGGAEIIIPNSKGLRVKVEYDSIDYKKEGFPFGRDSFKYAFEPVLPQESKFNFGFTYPISENFHLKLNYVKGNTISFGFSIQANLGSKDPLIKKDDPYQMVKNAEVTRKVNKKEQRYVYLTALKNMNERGLFLQAAEIEDDKLKVVYAQSTHVSWMRSTGRALRVLDDISPDYITQLSVANVNGGLGTHEVTIPRSIFQNNMEYKDFKLAARDATISNFTYDKKSYGFQPKENYPVTFWNLAPSLRSQIGGPDGFYFGDLRLSFHSETLFSPKLSFVVKASAGISNNFDELKLASDSVLPHVRTDIVKYLKQSADFAIERVQINYFQKPSKNLYFKGSIGIFEPMFGAVGGEMLYRPFKANYGIGAELWKVKQRSYKQNFNFRDYETTTGHINFYYREPRSNILMRLKGGKFLAGDSGINFDFERRFKSGLRMGVFFSKTDISQAEFGEGSFDKGFYFHIPVEIFFQKHAKGTAGFGLRPVTRDGAQILVHSHHLWGVTEQAQLSNLTRDWDDLYD